MEKTIFILIVAVFATVFAGPSDPEPRPDPNWMARHEGFVSNSANNPGIPIVFYGDSITDAWSGQREWREVFAPRGAVNYGISGDQVQHVLWRMQNGEVAGLNPKLIVLKIGTNNLGGHTAREIADGIGAIIRYLRTTLPNTRILLLSIFPRTGEGNYLKIATINLYIAKLHDGNFVVYQSLFDNMGQDWGTVDSALFPDGLHLSASGYTLWYNIMYPWFFALCDCPAP